MSADKPCAGMACGFPRDQEHSAQCIAEHAAAVAGGRFVPLGAETEALAAELQGKSDAAYCQYIEILRRRECLGWEHKTKTGKFGEAELKAHTLAAEHLGMHRAFAAAATDARALAALAQPVAPAEGMPMGWAILAKDGTVAHTQYRLNEFFGTVRESPPPDQEEADRLDRDYPGLAPHRIVTLYATPAAAKAALPDPVMWLGSDKQLLWNVKAGPAPDGWLRGNPIGLSLHAEWHGEQAPPHAVRTFYAAPLPEQAEDAARLEAVRRTAVGWQQRAEQAEALSAAAAQIVTAMRIDGDPAFAHLLARYDEKVVAIAARKDQP